MRLMSSLLVVVAFTGCATSPVPTDQARPINADALLPGYVRADVADGIPIIIKRDSGFSGAGSTLQVFVDGSPIAKLWPEEKVTVHLAAGDHLLGVWPTLQLGNVIRAEIAAHVSPSSPAVFRVGVANDAVFIRPTSE